MKRITGIRPLEETTIRFGGSGDNWHMTWAANDKQYVSLCDGKGLPGTPRDKFLNSRIYSAVGSPPDVTFDLLPAYPDFYPDVETPTRYYNFGILALDQRIYSFLSTVRTACPPENPDSRFVGAKLIYSPDNGQTWLNQDGSSPVRWEQERERSRDNMIFFEEPGDAFAFLTVLQMGRDYQKNTDGYVYIYAPNGSVEGTMNQLAMCRVAKDRILDRRAYEFFRTLRGDGSAEWSPRIEDRGPVYTFPSGWVNQKAHPYGWHPSVVYYAPTKQYLMANWGMGCTPDGSWWFGKPSYLGFWTAQHPWGPWTQVYEDTAWTPTGDQEERAYQVQIAPKWIAADGKSFWLVWTDYQEVEGKGRPYYAFNAQKAEVVIQ